MLYSTILTLAACATLSSAAGHGESRFIVHRRNTTVSSTSSGSVSSTTVVSSSVSPSATVSSSATTSTQASVSSGSTSLASSVSTPASSSNTTSITVVSSSGTKASASPVSSVAPASSAVESSTPGSSVAASSSAPAASSSAANGSGIGLTGVIASNNTINAGKRQLAGIPLALPLPIPALPLGGLIPAVPSVADLSGSLTDLTGVLSSVGNVGPIGTGPITGNSVGILAGRDLLSSLPIPDLSSLTSGGGLPVVSGILPSLPLGSVTGLLGSTTNSAPTAETSASSDAGLESLLKREPQLAGLPIPLALPALPLALPALPIALPNVADLSGSVTSLTGALGSVANVGGLSTPDITGNSIALGKRQLPIPLPSIPSLATNPNPLGGLPLAGLLAPITNLAGASTDFTGVLNSVGNVGPITTGEISGNALQVL